MDFSIDGTVLLINVSAILLMVGFMWRLSHNMAAAEQRQRAETKEPKNIILICARSSRRPSQSSRRTSLPCARSSRRVRTSSRFGSMGCRSARRR